MIVWNASSRNVRLAGVSPVPSMALGDEELLGDLDLLLLGVAGELQDFHAVAQRLRNRVQHVGRADEHHVREVVLDVEVVVEERVVLLRVEHLEQRRRRVAAEVHRHLVDFVEQEHRVLRPGLLHHLDDLAGEGADVGAAVAADLRFVTHAAERQPHELAVHRARDRLGERGLADSGRARERQDRRLRLLDQRADREELQDAVLDLLEPVVVLVEDGFGALEVAALFRLLVPRHRDQPVEVVARDGGFGRHRRHRLQPLQLLHRLLGDLFRHLRLFDLLLQLVDLVALLVLAAQFLLDRLHLLVEVVLLLRLLHLLLHARLDAAVHLELVDLGFEDAGDAVQALDGGDDLEQVLLLVHADEEVRGNRVGELARVVHADGGDHRVVVQVVRELHVLLEERHDAAHGRLGVGARLFALRDDLDDDAVEALVFLPLHGPRPLDAFDQHLDVAVGQLQALDDVRHAAHREDVGRLRVVDRGVVLRGQENPLVLHQRVLERAGGRGPSDDERHHHVWKHDDVAERDDREEFRRVPWV